MYVADAFDKRSSRQAARSYARFQREAEDFKRAEAAAEKARVANVKAERRRIIALLLSDSGLRFLAGVADRTGYKLRDAVSCVKGGSLQTLKIFERDYLAFASSEAEGV